MTCRFCNGPVAKKPEQKCPEGFPEFIFLVAQSLHEDACDKKDCQVQLQHECDEFDRCRKGE